MCILLLASQYAYYLPVAVCIVVSILLQQYQYQPVYAYYPFILAMHSSSSTYIVLMLCILQLLQFASYIHTYILYTSGSMHTYYYELVLCISYTRRVCVLLIVVLVHVILSQYQSSRHTVLQYYVLVLVLYESQQRYLVWILHTILLVLWVVLAGLHRNLYSPNYYIYQESSHFGCIQQWTKILRTRFTSRVDCQK